MKFVIAGGGTAGWVSAYTILKSNPGKHEVVVVESTKIGSIGAGEATSGLLYDLLSGSLFHNSETMNSLMPPFDFDDFMNKVSGVPKFALHHINWAKEKGSYLAPINGSETSKVSPDHILNYVLTEFGPEKAYLASVIGQCYDIDKMPKTSGYGFQFDAHKVGEYLRSYVLSIPNTRHIDSVITDVNVKPNGLVESLVLDTDEIISGDFFVDTTGFARVLAKKLEIKWVDYKDCMAVDRAMPFLVPYKEGEIIEPITVAEALSSGWMWRTPTGGRRGCGYVYSSEFISEDEAQREAEKIMGHPIEPIKHIKFEPGRVETFWKGNTLISGLASSFIEPLEATSIHATIMQIFTFCQEYLSDTLEKTLNPANIDQYNKKTTKMYEYYKDFTVFHYQGGREDSEFWRHIKYDKLTTPAVENYIERAKSRMPGVLHFMDFWGVDALWKWTLIGLNLYSKEQAMEELEQYDSYAYAMAHYRSFREETKKRFSDMPSFKMKPQTF
jgi:tryptophan halogenase